MIRIAAAGDLHFGVDSAGQFREHAADLAEQACVLLLAGDLTKRGRPEEAEVLGLTTFLMQVYDGHMEQQHGIHVGAEEEWRGYVAGLFKGDSGQYMPDASYVALEGGRIVGAILITHWMGMPLVAELGVAKDHRGKGLGRGLLQASMHRLAARDEPRLALYVTIGNDPAIALYRKMGFVQVGGESVTARLEG